jgi:mono/diheme cytochrome c family protein
MEAHFREPLAIVASAWLGIVATAGIASAQQATGEQTTAKIDLGKREFDSNCAVCHGLEGRGDGPFASVINKGIPNLTTLSKGNEGVFPFERVYQIIDGTQVPRGHGTREMPIWGDVYTSRAEKSYYLAPSLVELPFDPEAFARARILSLTEYIYRLQAKK